MDILPIELFGVLVDVPFAAPLGIKSASLDEFGAKICDPEKGLGLRAEQVRLKKWDELFGYEVSANFFGDNGTLTRTAERIKLGVRNARTSADWNVIHQTLLRFYTLMAFDPKSVTALSAHLHAKFSSAGERDDYLAQFGQNGAIVRPAGLGYVQIADWEKDIRVLIERSNIVPDAIFIAWDTQFVNAQDWDTFLGALPAVIENSANIFELGFEPFREQV